MSFASWAVKAEKFVADNSPLILTSVAVVGTVTTAYLTGKASFKAAQLIEQNEFQRGKPVGKNAILRERFKLVWPQYIPAAVTGVSTVACIVCANRIGTRRAAAMASAYAISEKAFAEYKEKIVEKLGENKEQEVRDEIAQDRVSASPVGKTEVIVTGGGDVLCYDIYTGRYFHSDMEAIKQAQNNLNYQLIHDNYASLNDFYDKIGLARTKTGEEVGWSSDKLMEIQFSTTMSDDDRPCIAIDFAVSPVRDYFLTH